MSSALYEELGVAEYWVVDVRNTQVIAYQMHDRGSNRLTTSEVLPELAIETLEEALHCNCESAKQLWELGYSISFNKPS